MLQPSPKVSSPTWPGAPCLKRFVCFCCLLFVVLFVGADTANPQSLPLGCDLLKEAVEAELVGGGELGLEAGHGGHGSVEGRLVHL